jgi:hypothetical protein
MTCARPSEGSLVLGFLLVIGGVPLTQTALELARGQRVPFTDVFRYRLTAANLRQYEQVLEDTSWWQQQLRPRLQRLLFDALGDTGAKAVRGREDWFFYRPDLRYLLETSRPQIDHGTGRGRGSAETPRPTLRGQADTGATTGAWSAILRVRDQLRGRGIGLLVMPVPGKPAVYPDHLTRRFRKPAAPVQSPTEDLLRELEREGVATVDLFSLFRQARAAPDHPDAALYLARDTHWTPAGAKLAAQAVARRLRELGVMAGQPPVVRETRSQQVRRWGDILDMMQLPGLSGRFPAELVRCEQVRDPVLGLLVPSASDRPGTYRHPARPSPVLVLGDSFCRIYQFAEPPSLGETLDAAPDPSGRSARSGMRRRLLPGSAGFLSLLSRELQMPVDAIVSDGGASTDVRRKLSTHPEILEGKRLVVWQFVERDIALGRAGWEDVPLPVKLD